MQSHLPSREQFQIAVLQEIDQLYVIQKALGPLTLVQNELFLQNTRFAGACNSPPRFPQMFPPW